MQTMRYGLEQARIKLPAIVADAAAGRSSIVTRHGKPIAAIVPLSHWRSVDEGADILSLAGVGAGLWGRDASRFVNDLRDEMERF